MLKHQATVLNSFAVRTKDQATPLHSFAVCKKNFALVFGSEAAGDGSLIALASGEISAMAFAPEKGAVSPFGLALSLNPRLIHRMSGTYTNLLTHLVFSTKDRYDLITPQLELELYPYLGGIIKGERGVPLAIGGTENHLHIPALLPPAI